MVENQDKQHDPSEKAFRAFTDQDFRTAKDQLEALRKQAEDLKQQPQDAQKRLSFIKQNLLLTAYYQNKAQTPHKLLAELQQLYQQFMPHLQLQPASVLLQQHQRPQTETKSLDLPELNTVLMYNCAVMAYQTQQLGVCMGNLTLILQHLDQFELFLQIKSLFLLLQVLYEMRQPEPAGPILALLEAKYLDLKAITHQKKQIKDYQTDD
jgi:hypothetical protein